MGKLKDLFEEALRKAKKDPKIDWNDMKQVHAYLKANGITDISEEDLISLKTFIDKGGEYSAEDAFGHIKL